MKTTLRNLAAIVAAVLISIPPALANDWPVHPMATAVRVAPRLAHNFAESWRPRPIRAVPVFPFSACGPIGSVEAAPLYYSVVPRAEPTITVTITVPVSVAKQLLASGAIKLPSL